MDESMTSPPEIDPPKSGKVAKISRGALQLPSTGTAFLRRFRCGVSVGCGMTASPIRFAHVDQVSPMSGLGARQVYSSARLMTFVTAPLR